MYSIDSADVYTSEAYKNIGGGGSQSARFHPVYRLWTRNLFDGAERAPVVNERQRVLVELPVTTSETQLQQAYDVVRDAALTANVGVLRLERRRGHLQDLFTGATS